MGFRSVHASPLAVGRRVAGFVRLVGLLLALLVGTEVLGRTALPWYRDPVLSSLLIQAMVTDGAGFRWVATDEGVYRYDGYETVPLKALVRQGATLPAELTTTLLLDRAGRLWIGSKAGLYRFEIGTGTLRHVRLPLAPDEAPAVLDLLCHPRTGRVWVVAGRGAVVVLDPDQPRHPIYPIERLRWYGQTTFLISPDAGNGVWVYNDEGYQARMGGDGRIRQQITLPEACAPVPNTRVGRFVTNDGLLEVDSLGQQRWVGRWPRSWGILYGGWPHFPNDSTCEVISKGVLLQLTGLRGARPQLQAVPLELGAGASNDLRYRIGHDRYGTSWCYSPLQRGCFKQRDRRQTVEAVLLADGKPAASARAIRRLPTGQLLVSTYGGQLVQAADSPDAPLRPNQMWKLGPKKERVNGVAFSILPVLGGTRLIIADENWSFLVTDPTGTTLLERLALPDYPLHTWALLQDQAGRIWGGVAPGLYQLDVQRRTLTRYGDAVPGWPLHAAEVKSLAEDTANHALWLATSAGLLWHRPTDHALRSFTLGGAVGRRLPTNAVQAVAAAGPGQAWVATLDQGLLLVDAVRGVVRQLHVANGLPSAAVATVLVDPAGTVWAGTYAGLVRYVPATNRLSVYREAEGLTNPELNRCSLFRDADGTLWFGGVGGVFRLSPGAATAEPPRAAARLLVAAVGASVGGATPTVRQVPTGQPEGVTLAAGAYSMVELRLALTDHYDPERTRYAYRLHQPDGTPLTHWLPTARNLVLRGLRPGDYQVQVRAEVGVGQPLVKPIRIPLHVEAEWWQLPIVWALAALLLMSGGYGIYWLQLRRVRREARLRAELSANLHDEVGSLLTRVNLLAEVLRNQYQPSEAAREGGTGLPDGRSPFDHLLSNSRAAVQTMRDVVWGIDSRADSVGALADRMRDHLDETARDAGLKILFHAPERLDRAALSPAVRQHVYLIFKEAVTNVLRHARGATELSIRLTLDPGDLLTLEITDDGQPAPGRRPETAGMGLRNMRQRATAIGATLEAGPRPDAQPGYRVLVRVRTRR